MEGWELGFSMRKRWKDKIETGMSKRYHKTGIDRRRTLG